MTIIDVSGHNNNCGLYSLGLAVSLAIQKNGVGSGSVPDFLATIEERDVAYGNHQLEQLGARLRDAIADALKKDVILKERYFNIFLQMCLSENKSVDMESFFKSSEKTLKAIKGDLEFLIRESLVSNLVEPNISENEINDCVEELKSLMNFAAFSRDNINDWLVEKNQANDIYKFCILFHSVWSKITEETPNREETKSAVEKWFFMR